MRLARLAVLLLGSCLLCTGAIASGAGFTAKDGVWLDNGKPFCSTSAHAIFHHFRENREEGIKELAALKAAGFTTVEVYWQWGKDLDPATNEYSFTVFDDFMAQCKRIGLKVFCMFQEYVPQWLADKHGWGHTSEEGKRDVRVDDFYVCDPTFKSESKRFYTTLIRHLKDHPEISEDLIYFNMGGEYKPFRPNRQPKPLDYGYDDLTVAAFRKWLAAKGWTLESIARRWGAPAGAYSSWEDVWPAINMKGTDYKGRSLSRIGAARWDWFEFRQDVSTQHMADAVKWLREAGEKRPLIHEYNTVMPGGQPLFLDWSRVGARAGKDGIYMGTGTFDREFDFPSLLYNLAIARGASDAPWQSNEQKGNTSPEWMARHAWMLMALGGTGVHFWEWRGDDWGVVKTDASPSEGYAPAVRLNAQIEFLGDLLNASKPMPNRIGILALAEETLFLPGGHDTERTAVLRSLLEIGSGGEVAVITDDQVLNQGLSGYKLVITCGQARMRRSVREKLAEFVRKGGTLWITPGSAVKDETDADLAAIPGAPLDAVAGVRVTGDVEPVVGPVSGKRSPVPYGILDKSAAATTATPVWSIGDKPIIWRNSYGKGTCYTQLAQIAYPPAGDSPITSDPEGLKYYLRSNAGQLPPDLLREILKERGIEPYAKAWNSGGPPCPLIVGVRKADPGYLVIVVEGDNRYNLMQVDLNVKRLGLTGEWFAYQPMSNFSDLREIKNGSIQTTIDPAEVKVFHLVPARRALRWDGLFRHKDWPAIEAKLPPIPPRELLPPSEIGKVDPGDLANVRPKPYGDKWLLVDLSKHANRSLVDEGKQENAKAFLGSVGVGDNDLGRLPKGITKLLGVPYDILDPAVSSSSCLITKTNGRPWLGPLEFAGIPVRDKVSRIHWLYGAGWAPFELPIGYVTYHFSDGTKAQENIICARNIMNWWGRAQQYESDKLQLAWSGSTPAASRNYTSVGLYHYAWENPNPDKTLESIDITSYGGDACIIVVAITGER